MSTVVYASSAQGIAANILKKSEKQKLLENILTAVQICLETRASKLKQLHPTRKHLKQRTPKREVTQKFQPQRQRSFVNGPRIGHHGYQQCENVYRQKADAQLQCSQRTNCQVIHSYNCRSKFSREFCQMGSDFRTPVALRATITIPVFQYLFVAL